MTGGEWYYSPDHRQLCQVIESQTLWGETTCRVWLPGRDSVVCIPASKLKPLSEAATGTVEGLRYIAAAARVADALTREDVLLAPIESSVIPLPHQIRALSRATSGNRVRYLLADEVGLGKTIEAGLILRELKLRGLVSRTLVIAPKGLVTQWVAEMMTHFSEEFRLLIPSEFSAYRHIAQGDNVWRAWPQVVCPMDSVKPIDGRRGWSKQQVDDYNHERFEGLISADWDLVIVDEAHRLAGSTQQVSRYRLGQGLAEAAPYLLLLSATPHQGKTDSFHRLISLIDYDEFPDIDSVTRERVQPYVIRTEKGRAIDAEGKPLFKPRRTALTPVRWEERHQAQRSLYEAVTEYVRLGYNQALHEKKSYIGFLMILMQRLVVSSTRAIRTTLERRLDVLQAPQEQLTLFPMDPDEWVDLDGQEQIETLLRTRLTALKDERAEVELLLNAARRCEQTAPDAKAEALLDWIYRLQAEEGDPELKVLVFTEFLPTQEMLATFLADRGFSIVCLNGTMDMDERKRAQETFSKEAHVLISTDAGGEGLNLQFCHVVVNYDIPWNPMRLEQRIGRVDRIGQKHAVRAINFVFENSVEYRVREVLEKKLAVIFEEFGIDKTSDVLDSAQAGEIFDELYVEAILNPDSVDNTVASVVNRVRRVAEDAQQGASLLSVAVPPDPKEAQRLMSHPLPHWVECMTINYLKAYGGRVEKEGRMWKLTWPDGEMYSSVVFMGKDVEEIPPAHHLTLEDPKVRGLAMRLPRFGPGQPIPCVEVPGITDEVKGFWSLWQITAVTSDWNRRRIMPLFLADNGKVYTPTARHIWDQLLVANIVIHSILGVAPSQGTLARLQKEAEIHGKPVYEELVQESRFRINREREKAEYAFAARRKSIERIGLPQVRNYRMNLLAEEERGLHEQLERRTHAYPQMEPLALIRVEGGTYE